MKLQTIKTLSNNFESYANEINGVEFWFARDLQKLLGYTKWANFEQVIDKAKTACLKAGQKTNDHFADAGKTIAMPKTAEKVIKDLMLTRYACYLIAQNGDSRKEEIAFAMNYFAIQTRKQEILEARIANWERLQAREKLSFSEKELSEVIYERSGSEQSFSLVRSKGDKALFGGYTTRYENKIRSTGRKSISRFSTYHNNKSQRFC
ncbi:MAG: BRO family protein [Ignavibacteriaceae bacterium]|nr:BRO family protein [Ignavibacteriaceae bacterium]